MADLTKLAALSTAKWDETKPAGTRDINLGDDDIREEKSQDRERMDVDHNRPADETAVDNLGAHKAVHLIAQGARPSSIAGIGIVYTKVVSGVPELFYEDINNNEIQITNGGAINVSVASTITGEIRLWSTNVAPTGWLICDGSAVLRATYATLFALMGTTYGSGDGANTFNLPDMTGRVVVGRKGADADFATLGETGGEKTHVLTTPEMPAHTHTYTLGSLSVQSGSDTLCYREPSSAASTSSTGGGGAHNNLQPYICVNYIIKY